MSEKNLIETQLGQARASKSPRSFLINGKLRLTGIVKAFDGHMVMLDCHGVTNLLYRHSITDISETRGYARPETAAARKTVQPRDRERGRERKPSPPAPRPLRESERPAPQPHAQEKPMPGALGEELRKWLERSGK